MDDAKIENMSMSLADALDDLEKMDYEVSGSYGLKDAFAVIEVVATSIAKLDGISRTAMAVMLNNSMVYWIEPSAPRDNGVQGLAFRIKRNVE